VALWLRRFRIARLAAAGQVSLILRSTLRLLLSTLAVGTVVLLPSFAYLFYVFRGRRRRRTTAVSDCLSCRPSSILDASERGFRLMTVIGVVTRDATELGDRRAGRRADHAEARHGVAA
jgi:hypothetical protein